MLRIGELLVAQGVLTEAQVEQALGVQRSVPEPFGAICERLFGISPEIVEGAWAEQYEWLTRDWNAQSIEGDSEVRELVSARQAWQFRVLPVRFEQGALVLATTARFLPRALRFATKVLRYPAIFMLIEPQRLAEALSLRYPIRGLDANTLDLLHIQQVLLPVKRR